MTGLLDPLQKRKAAGLLDFVSNETNEPLILAKPPLSNNATLQAQERDARIMARRQAQERDTRIMAMENQRRAQAQAQPQAQPQAWNQEDIPEYASPEGSRIPDYAVAGLNEAIENIARYSNESALNPDEKNDLRRYLMFFRRHLEGMGLNSGSAFSDLFKRYMTPDQHKYFMEEGGSVLEPDRAQFEWSSDWRDNPDHFYRNERGKELWDMISPFIKRW